MWRGNPAVSPAVFSVPPTGVGFGGKSSCSVQLGSRPAHGRGGGRPSAWSRSAGGPRLEVTESDHDEPSNTLVGRSLTLPDQAGEMRSVQPCQLGGGGGGQQLVRVRLGGTFARLFCHGGSLAFRIKCGVHGVSP
jgi:hypothetical protein